MEEKPKLSHTESLDLNALNFYQPIILLVLRPNCQGHLKPSRTLLTLTTTASFNFSLLFFTWLDFLFINYVIDLSIAVNKVPKETQLELLQQVFSYSQSHHLKSSCSSRPWLIHYRNRNNIV